MRPARTSRPPGLELAELGQSDEALKAFYRAVDADPALADALFNLADAFQETGRREEGRPVWKAFLSHCDCGEWHDYALACLEPAVTRR
jgi:tetratricopeptide (TPR) repeat protein